MYVLKLVKMRRLLSAITILMIFAACDTVFVPKPTGFNAISLPVHDYELYNDTSKPYLFSKSMEAAIEPYITEIIKEEEDYIKVVYPELGGAIWVTYKKIGNNLDTLNSYISNSFRLADGHNVKATGIDSEVIPTKEGHYALSIILEGDVSSQYQFYVHDSTTNFMRFALYFETATKNDSLAPVIDYLKEDMDHILSTLEWRSNAK